MSPKHTPKPSTTPAQGPKATEPEKPVVQTAASVSMDVGGPVGANEPIGLAEDVLGAGASDERSPAGLRGYSKGVTKALGWDDAWGKVKGPLEQKMLRIQELLRAEGVVTDSVGLNDGDDGSGFALGIGTPTPASKDSTPIVLTATLWDAQYDEGKLGDYWISFETVGVDALALRLYAPGNYTNNRYVQSVEALLERIEGLDVAAFVQNIIEDGRKNGWQLHGTTESSSGVGGFTVSSARNPAMKLLKQINNLKMLHDAEGSGSVFVKAPNGVLLEEFKTKADNSDLDKAIAAAEEFCRETTDYLRRS